jgi:hypothetical protein
MTKEEKEMSVLSKMCQTGVESFLMKNNSKNCQTNSKWGSIKQNPSKSTLLNLKDISKTPDIVKSKSITMSSTGMYANHDGEGWNSLKNIKIPSATKGRFIETMNDDSNPQGEGQSDSMRSFTLKPTLIKTKYPSSTNNLTISNFIKAEKEQNMNRGNDLH